MEANKISKNDLVISFLKRIPPVFSRHCFRHTCIRWPRFKDHSPLKANAESRHDTPLSLTRPEQPPATLSRRRPGRRASDAPAPALPGG